MAIDLSKLKALELPSKEVTAEVLGEPQKITITAYGYDLSLQMNDIRENFPTDGEFRVWVLLMTTCAGMSEEEATLYIVKDYKGAAALIKEINALTRQFDKMCEDKRQEAKKKFTTALD